MVDQLEWFHTDGMEKLWIKMLVKMLFLKGSEDQSHHGSVCPLDEFHYGKILPAT